MSVHIFQIGAYPIHLHGAQPEYKMDDSGKTTELAWSPNVIRPYTQYLPKLKTLSMKGTLLPTCNWSPQQQEIHMQNLLGLETDIIGYVIYGSCCPHGMGCCQCCACSVGQRFCEPLWLHTRGKLKSFNVDPKTYQVDIQLELNAYWKPLNNTIWEFTEFTKEPFENICFELECEFSPYPTCDMIYDCGSCMVWHKKIFDNRYALYNPAIWLDQQCNNRLSYPDIFYIENWISEETTRKVWVDESVWSAPTLSIYQFRNLVGVSTISISVKYQFDTWDSKTQVANINITQLNANLIAASLPALNSGDRLILGDIKFLPGFIIRADESVITTIEIPITYDGFYVGALYPGMNEVTINNNDSQYSYLALHRRL